MVEHPVCIRKMGVRFSLGPQIATLQIFGSGKRIGKRSLLAAPAGAARSKFSQKVKRLDKIKRNNFVRKRGVRSDFLNKKFNFVKIVRFRQKIGFFRI